MLNHLFIKLFFSFLVFYIQTSFTYSQIVCENAKFRNSFTSIVSAKSGFVAPLPGGGYIFDMTAYNDECLVKLDAKGGLLWAKKYLTNFGFSNVSLKGTIDKNDNIVSSLGDNVVIITNQNGDVLVSKRLYTPSQGASILGIVVASNNDKILLFRDNSTYAGNGYMLVRFSGDLSNIKWNKHFNAQDLYLNELELTDDKIMVAGIKSTVGYFMIFNAVDGELLQQKELFLDAGGLRYNVAQIKKYNNGYIVLVENYDNSPANKALLRFDLSFNLKNSYYLQPLSNSQKMKIIVDSSGAVVASGAGITDIFFYLRITARDSIVLSKWGPLAWLSSPTDFKKTQDGFALLSSNTYNAVGVGYFGFALLTNFDANGNIESSEYCNSRETVIQKKACDATINTTQLIARDTNVLQIESLPIDTTPETFYQIDKSCLLPNECNTLQIAGPTSLCGYNNVIFKAVRNQNCTSPVNWKAIGDFVDLDILTDSTVQLNFNHSGLYKLEAAIYNICDTIRDTIELPVTLNKGILDLGTDSYICPSNTILLNAHSGYTYYKWQDGKTDSTYSVTSPGKYYVTVNDACGGTYSDTVNITPAPPVPLSIGPDRTKCNNDTLKLSAPSGFLNYSWSPVYNINSITSQDVIINPVKDTTYFIKAEKTPGCFGFDTIRIKVNTSPIINLGNDTSFCSGDSIILNAGTGFSNYVWNGNNGTKQLVAKQKGDYIIKATTSQGCSSSDTVTVLNVFANPVVQLNQDTAICTGSSKTLDAGTFSSYLWNTGSTSKTITVNAIGMYAVAVIDNNGCKGADTSYLAKILPLPQQFLPGDTTICSYGDITLQALQNYNAYLWNDNSNSSSLKISKPGIYSLQVTDKYNCTGKDSIIVTLKDCMLGFYIPNTFTPNNDGRNDIFRPLVFGNIIQYKFTVYNRWGQIIYQSTAPGEGWDGFVKGTAEKSGIYLWTCIYQLEGETPISKKGTVTLIK